MSDIATGKDADFSEERLVERYNADLANSLGNLLNRALPMTQKYRSGMLRSRDPVSVRLFHIMVSDRQISDSDFGSLDPASRQITLGIADLLLTINAVVKSYPAIMDAFEANEILKGITAICTKANVRIEATAPWHLAKDKSKGDELDELLYALGECLRILAILISPVLPKAAHGIFDQLNWKMELSGKEQRFRLEDAKWGGLPDEHIVGKPVPLFPRIEL